MTAIKRTAQYFLVSVAFYNSIICCGCGSKAEYATLQAPSVSSVADSDLSKQNINDNDTKTKEDPSASDYDNIRTPEDKDNSVSDAQTYSILPGIPLDGPFDSVLSFCKMMKQKHRKVCTNEKRNWSIKNLAGKRKDILKAETAFLLLDSKENKEKAFSCVVMLQTDKGWWASADDSACESSSDDSYTTKRSSLEQLRYADELGSGVLLIERQLEFPYEVPVLVDGKEYTGTTQGITLERKYCSVESYQPYCTDWMITSFDQESVAVTHNTGEILITGNEKSNAKLWQTGRYRLFKDERLIPFSAPSDIWTDTAAHLENDNAIAFERLFGPYDSISHYCDAPPSFDDLQIVWEEEQNYTKYKCPVSKGKWNESFSNTNGAISNVRLFMHQGDLAGAPIEYCEIAIQTKNGWFVTRSTEHCQGVVGPGHDAKRVLLNGKINRTDNLEILELLYERTDTRLEYGTPKSYDIFSRVYDAADLPAAMPRVLLAGTKMAAPKSFREQTVEEKKLFVKFCSVGESNVPSCTNDIYRGCRSKIKTASAAPLWKFESDMLILPKRETKPYDCEDWEEPLTGTYRLSFP